MAAPFCGHCGTLLSEDGSCCRCLLEVGVTTQSLEATEANDRAEMERLGELFPHYEFLGVVGRGGMGVVFQARHRRLGRKVAVKVLAPRWHDTPAFTQRFEREARTMASLDHPGIVGVHDFGIEDGACVLFLEFVDGANLRELMESGRPEISHTLDLVHQIASALADAHSRGIVHRDIKPENVLVDDRGRVRLADFGLARLVGDELGASRLTHSRQVLGTPHYMAPEQVEQPAAVDHRADLYSLGVLFYELLTGALPLGRFSPPSVRAPCDPRLDTVILGLLEPDPQRRTSDADVLLRQLDEFTGRGNGTPTLSAANSGRWAEPRAPAELWTGLVAGSALLTFGADWTVRPNTLSWQVSPLDTPLGDLAFGSLLVLLAVWFVQCPLILPDRPGLRPWRGLARRLLGLFEVACGGLAGIAIGVLLSGATPERGWILFPILAILACVSLVLGGLLRGLLVLFRRSRFSAPANTKIHEAMGVLAYAGVLTTFAPWERGGGPGFQDPKATLVLACFAVAALLLTVTFKSAVPRWVVGLATLAPSLTATVVSVALARTAFAATGPYLALPIAGMLVLLGLAQVMIAASDTMRPPAGETVQER